MIVGHTGTISHIRIAYVLLCLLSFILGQSNQPSGLQEGLLLMHEGEKAIMIIPSYLAYGVTGDGVCIPGSSSILYTVKLEKVVY